MAKKKTSDDKLLKEVVGYMQQNGKKLPKNVKVVNGEPVYVEPADYIKGSKKKK